MVKILSVDWLIDWLMSLYFRKDLLLIFEWCCGARSEKQEWCGGLLRMGVPILRMGVPAPILKMGAPILKMNGMGAPILKMGAPILHLF